LRFHPGHPIEYAVTRQSIPIGAALVRDNMQVPPTDDPILRRFRDALVGLYGERLERAVLFGSRARGDAQPDSDYDMAVFLRDYHELWDEAGPLADATTEILYDTGTVLTPIPFPAGAYRERTALMNEIRQDGIDL
jgi:predicted nucleotidyltransferase